MQSEKYAAYRAKWLANRHQERLAASPINKRPVVQEEPEEPPGRAHLTWEQFEAIRAATLEGLKVMANDDPVSSMRFKVLRDAWSRLAPMQGRRRFVIEVSDG